MPPWPIGVFASIDAGLGVHLDVARELKVPTMHLMRRRAMRLQPKHSLRNVKRPQLQ